MKAIHIKPEFIIGQKEKDARFVQERKEILYGKTDDYRMRMFICTMASYKK